MFESAILNRLKYFALYLLAFTIPLPYTYANISIFIYIFFWILTVNRKQLLNNLKTGKMLWVYIAYFIIFLAGYYYSTNKDQSLFDSSSKMFFLILPIIIGAGISIEKKQLQNIFFAFILGVTAIALSSSVRAYTQWQASGDVNNLFYHSLVKDFDANAVYMALYSFFSISLLLMFDWSNFFNGNKRFIKYLLITIQVTFFVLLSARMLTLLFVIFLIPYYIMHVFKSELSKKRVVISLAILLLLSVTILFTNNPIKTRFADFTNKSSELAFLDDYSKVEEGDFNTLTLRLFLWRIGIENVKEKNLWWFGCGNGDAQAMQNAKLKEYGMRNIHEELALRSPFYNVNLHNMYLQTLMMTGIIGLIILLIFNLHPFFIYKKYPELVYFFPFHVSATFFMIQESMFQTQAGIAYYTLFSIIFYNIYYNKVSVKN